MFVRGNVDIALHSSTAAGFLTSSATRTRHRSQERRPRGRQQKSWFKTYKSMNHAFRTQIVGMGKSHGWRVWNMEMWLVLVLAVMGSSRVVGMTVAPVGSLHGVTHRGSQCCEYFYNSKWDEFNKCVPESGVTPTCNTTKQTQQECQYLGKQYAVGETVLALPAQCVRFECILLPQRKVNGEKLPAGASLRLITVDDHPGCCMKGGRMFQHGYKEKVEEEEGHCSSLTCLHGTWVTGGKHHSCGNHLKECITTLHHRYQHGDVVKVVTSLNDGGMCTRHTCHNGHIKKDKCCCVEKGRRFNDTEMVEDGAKSDQCYQWVCQQGVIVSQPYPRCCENPRGELVPPGHPMLLDLPKCMLVVCVEGTVTSDRSITGQCGCCESGLSLFTDGTTHQADPCFNTTCTNTTWINSISPQCGECMLTRQGGDWPKLRTLTQVWSELRSSCIKYNLIQDGSQVPTIPSIYVSIGRCTRRGQGFYSSYNQNYKVRNFREFYGDDDEGKMRPFSANLDHASNGTKHNNNNNNNSISQHIFKKRHHNKNNNNNLHPLSYEEYHSHNRIKRHNHDHTGKYDDEDDQSLWCMNSVTIHNPMINVTLLVSGRILVNNKEVSLPYSNSNWTNFVVGSYPNTLIVRVGKAMVWLTREQEMKIMGVVAPKDSNLRGLCVRGSNSIANNITSNLWDAGEMCYPMERKVRIITDGHENITAGTMKNTAETNTNTSSCSEERRLHYSSACYLLVSQEGLGENCSAVVTEEECVTELCANQENHDLHIFYDMLLRHMEECGLVEHKEGDGVKEKAAALALALLPVVKEYFERVPVTNETFTGIMHAVNNFLTFLSPSVKQLWKAVIRVSDRFFPRVTSLLMKSESALTQSKIYLLNNLERSLSLALSKLEPSLVQFIRRTSSSCSRFIHSLYEMQPVMSGYLVPVVMPKIEACIQRDTQIFKHIISHLEKLGDEVVKSESIDNFEHNVSQMVKSIQVLMSIDQKQLEKIGRNLYKLFMNTRHRILEQGIAEDDLRCTLDPTGLCRLIFRSFDEDPVTMETSMMTSATTTTSIATPT
ncbi:hypothetical protein Pmani_001425 [Petrolisthes manimaculis]|uniref:Uncharacterized protein n=1 Tax=Petrolisthes manimaculis TaxID=1843537 RepID=A0AAE1QKL6_9EUCA|nr:hypothetical protein Pmani_001425 [Petrolisthes manimaculis]